MVGCTGAQYGSLTGTHMGSWCLQHSDYTEATRRPRAKGAAGDGGQCGPRVQGTGAAVIARWFHVLWGVLDCWKKCLQGCGWSMAVWLARGQLAIVSDTEKSMLPGHGIPDWPARCPAEHILRPQAATQRPERKCCKTDSLTDFLGIQVARDSERVKWNPYNVKAGPSLWSASLYQKEATDLRE